MHECVTPPILRIQHSPGVANVIDPSELRKHVKRLYKAAVRGLHPDLQPDDPEKLEAFKLLGASYQEILKHLDSLEIPRCLLQDGNCKAADCPDHGWTSPSPGFAWETEDDPAPTFGANWWDRW